jgi:hypothetical protein
MTDIPIDPNKLIERLIDENPGASCNVIAKLFSDAIANDPDLQTQVLESVFDDIWKALHPVN